MSLEHVMVESNIMLKELGGQVKRTQGQLEGAPTGQTENGMNIKNEE